MLHLPFVNRLGNGIKRGTKASERQTMETSTDLKQRSQSCKARTECKPLQYTAAEYKSGYLQREEGIYITGRQRERE